MKFGKILIENIEKDYEKYYIPYNDIKKNINLNSDSFLNILFHYIDISEVFYKTNKNKKLIVNLALNYGSKSELKNAFNKLKKRNSKITEPLIGENLYTSNLPDPDILIRTGGQKRLSNFMLWQLAYSELYFLDKLWPDFNSSDLKKIIRNYKIIKRNFGNI